MLKNSRWFRAVVVVGVICMPLPVVAAGRSIADAAERQDRAAVRQLIASHTDVNQTQGDGTTALHWAAHWNDAETVSALIAAGANVNATTDESVTPLLLASENTEPSVVSALLLAAGETGLPELGRLRRSETAPNPNLQSPAHRPPVTPDQRRSATPVRVANPIGPASGDSH